MSFNRRKIPLFIIVFLLLFLAAAIPYTVYLDSQCEKRGGVPSRVGCLNPEIFK